MGSARSRLTCRLRCEPLEGRRMLSVLAASPTDDAVPAALDGPVLVGPRLADACLAGRRLLEPVGERSEGDAVVDLAIPQVESSYGFEADVPIQMQRGDATIYGIDLVVSYDYTALSVVDVTPGLAGDVMFFIVNTNVPGFITVAMSDPQPFDRDGVLLKMTFDVVGTLSTPADVEFESVAINEGTIAAITHDGAVVDTIAPHITVAPLDTPDGTPPLAGTVADPHAAITITVDGQPYSATNHGDGSWSLADNVIAPPLAPGHYTVGAVAVDPAGNIGSNTGALYVAIPGDADYSGSVNELDAAIVAAHWGNATGATWDDGDFNGDGRVGAADASIMAANWGAHAESEAASAGQAVPDGDSSGSDSDAAAAAEPSVERSVSGKIVAPVDISPTALADAALAQEQEYGPSIWRPQGRRRVVPGIFGL